MHAFWLALPMDVGMRLIDHAKIFCNMWMACIIFSVSVHLLAPNLSILSFCSTVECIGWIFHNSLKLLLK